jgi:hypothetical protein
MYCTVLYCTVRTEYFVIDVSGIINPKQPISMDDVPSLIAMDHITHQFESSSRTNFEECGVQIKHQSPPTGNVHQMTSNVRPKTPLWYR